MDNDNASATSFAVTTSPQIIKELNLEENIFDSIKLNSEQKLMLKSLKLKIRDFSIGMVESKFKSYASFMNASKNHIEYKFGELYSVLLLDN